MKKIKKSIKLLYGFGFAAAGIKDGLFQLFLFFYYSQILGLEATLAGLATIISLFFDAISDPLVGVLSDRFKSKNWGRRHPFMLAAALPLGVFIWLLFLPPSGLGQMGLFTWLTIFTILVRISITFYLVPGMSLGAELSTDYEERTSITSYRIMFSALVGPLIIIFGLLTFFKKTEQYDNGMFNVGSYPDFAMLCGILMILAILVSTIGTKSVIPHLPKTPDIRPTFSEFKKSVAIALKLQSYRTLVAYVMVVYIAIGVGTVFTPYFTNYFFGMNSEDLAGLLVASALGGIIALFIAPSLSKKFDKKETVILSTIIFSISFSLPFTLRLLGYFPENDSSLLLPTYLFTLLIAYVFLWIALSLASSMMADVVDEFELISQKRDEGLFFSSLSFAYKTTVGIGYFVAGILLDWISFPKQAKPEDVSQDILNDLGLIGGPILMLIYISSIFIIYFYPISKERYLEIRKNLDAHI